MEFACSLCVGVVSAGRSGASHRPKTYGLGRMVTLLGPRCEIECVFPTLLPNVCCSKLQQTLATPQR